MSDGNIAREIAVRILMLMLISVDAGNESTLNKKGTKFKIEKNRQHTTTDRI